MKKFTEKEFDEYIRSRLYDYEKEPPADVFQSLKKDMKPNYKWLTIAGSGLFVIALSWFVYQLSIDNSPSNAVSTVPQVIVEETITNTNESTSISDNNKAISNVLIALNQAKTVIKKESSDKTQETQKVSVVHDEPVKSTPLVDKKAKDNYAYDIIVSPSTCKKRNGKAQIRCSNEEVSFYWEDLHITKPMVDNLKNGTYKVLAKLGDKVIDTLLVIIPDSGSVKANFNLFDTVVGNELITFTENLSLVEKKKWNTEKNVSFYWNFGDGTVSVQPEPRHVFANSGTYQVSLVVKSLPGCTDTMVKSYVVEIPLNYVEFPNVFSPNGDGIHDVFSPVLYDMKSIECTIFDRNGVLIYEWKTLDGFWDGKIRNTNQLASPGVYYYILKGTTNAGKPVIHKGMVQLVL